MKREWKSQTFIGVLGFYSIAGNHEGGSNLVSTEYPKVRNMNSNKILVPIRVDTAPLRSKIIESIRYAIEPVSYTHLTLPTILLV